MVIRKIEAIHGVTGVIIGHSFGGKSLGAQSATGSIRLQRPVPGGLKAVMQSAKGLQEIFIRCDSGCEEAVAHVVNEQFAG